MKSSLKNPLTLAFAAIFSFLAGAGSAASFNTGPISDAFVATGSSGNLSGNNFGAAGALAVAAPGLPQGEFQSVLQFDLSGARNSFDAQLGAGQWSIQSATLQLSSSPHNNAIFNNVAAGQFNVSLMQNNGWVEGTGTGGVPTTDGISYNSLQSTYINNVLDQSLGTFSFPGGTSGANSYGLSLASGLSDDLLAGIHLSLRLYAADNQVSYLFSSRMGGAVLQPELTFTAVPEPASLALWAMGLAALLLLRRSKVKPQAQLPKGVS